MSSDIDFEVATSRELGRWVGRAVKKTRLALNLTQAEVGARAGATSKTVERLENEGVANLDSFLRILKALGLASNLSALVPDTGVRPVDRALKKVAERKRARPRTRESRKPWRWGDEG